MDLFFEVGSEVGEHMSCSAHRVCHGPSCPPACSAPLPHLQLAHVQVEVVDIDARERWVCLALCHWGCMLVP